MLTCSEPKASVPAAYIPVQWSNQFFFLLPLCVCVTQSLPACFLEEHIPCRAGHPSERWVALIRRCHFLGAGIDLVWGEQRSDSPATKIRPSLNPPAYLRTRMYAHACTHKHVHKVKKSSRSECMHAARACQCGSGWRGSTCAGWLGRKRMGTKGRGREAGHQTDKNTV